MKRGSYNQFEKDTLAPCKTWIPM